MSINTERPPETPASQTPQISEFDGQVVRSAPADSMAARREQAIKRIKAKNDFIVHLLIYLTINAMIVFSWAFTGTGFFWPIFPIVLWGIGLVAHAYQVYGGTGYSEARIRREMENLP